MNSEVLALLLGGGGVAFLTAVFKGLQSLYSGARGSQRQAIADLERWRKEEGERARKERVENDFLRKSLTWQQNRTGRLEYEMSRAGMSIPPPDVPPPTPPAPEDRPDSSRDS